MLRINHLSGFSSRRTGASLDADAQAFITAAGITDNAQKTAINNFVVDMKGASLWTKMKAIYPFVGGTATTHKFNLKDPRDLDAAFRLTYGAHVGHGANGITTTSGTTSLNMADTNLVPTAQFSTNDCSFGAMMHALPTQTAGHYFGVDGSAASDIWRMSSTANANEHLATVGGNNRTNSSITVTDFICVVNNDTTNLAQVYIAGAAAGATIATGTGVRPDISIGLLKAKDSGGPSGSGSGRIMKFAFIGDILTAGEVSSLNTLVVDLQADLGR